MLPDNSQSCRVRNGRNGQQDWKEMLSFRCRARTEGASSLSSLRDFHIYQSLVLVQYDLLLTPIFVLTHFAEEGPKRGNWIKIMSWIWFCASKLTSSPVLVYCPYAGYWHKQTQIPYWAFHAPHCFQGRSEGWRELFPNKEFASTWIGTTKINAPYAE